MWRSIRSAVAPVLCLLIALGGVSYALASSVDDDTSGDEIVLQTETDDDPGENVEEEEGDDEVKPEKTPKVSKTPKPRSTEGCTDGFEGNHGQFVSKSDDKQAAAHSACGKPVKKDKKEKKAKKMKAEKTPKPEKSPKADEVDDDDQGEDDQGEDESDDESEVEESEDEDDNILGENFEED